MQLSKHVHFSSILSKLNFLYFFVIFLEIDLYISVLCIPTIWLSISVYNMHWLFSLYMFGVLRSLFTCCQCKFIWVGLSQFMFVFPFSSWHVAEILQCLNCHSASDFLLEKSVNYLTFIWIIIWNNYLTDVLAVKLLL